MRGKSHLEDKSLLASIKEGDQHAFDLFFMRHYTILCAYARQFLSMDMAREVVQDLMVGLWEGRSTLNIESSVQAYLFRAVKNRCLTQLNRSRIRENVHVILENNRKDSFENPDFYVAEDLQHNLTEALKQMPPNYREAFVMHCFQQLSYKRIAEILGVSHKTVDYRISQTRKLLRFKLREFLPTLFV